MAERTYPRAHLITGGYPPGSAAGHDHDHARLRLLALLAEREIPASVGNDFADVAKWLPVSRMLITYVAGPYPDAAQSAAMQAWVEAGGHWLALRRTVKTEHHALLGSFFLTHPPICRFRVDVSDVDHPLTQGIGRSFDVEDEPYFIELQHPDSTRILLTAEYGSRAVSPIVAPLYGSDTSLQPDGRTRVLGYTRAVGGGQVTYLTLGHCHNPASREGRPAAEGEVPVFRGSWESEAFTTLLRNAIAWGTKL